MKSKKIAALLHLSALLGFIFPFGNILAPLIIWLTQRNKSEFVNQCGKEAINFQISISIYTLVGFILYLLLIGIILVPVIAVFQIVCVAMAAIKTYDNEVFRYPLSFTFIQ